MPPASRRTDRVAGTFDEPNLVADAGSVLVAALAKQLGLEKLCDGTIDLSGRAGGFWPGRRILMLVHAMVAVAPHIDHAGRLRAGATAAVLERRVMAPSTLGTFRSCRRSPSATCASSSQLEPVRKSDQPRQRLRRGARRPPALGDEADTGEIPHARLRAASAGTQRGIERFVEEPVARLRRAEASGAVASCAGTGSPAPKRPCGPTGATSPSRATSRARCARSTPSGAPPRWSSSPSTTGRRAGVDPCPSGSLSANGTWLCGAGPQPAPLDRAPG